MAKQKDIFRTLKCYSHGFHTHATEEENKAYDAKVEELKATINGTVFEFNQRPGDCCGRVLGD